VSRDGRCGRLVRRDGRTPRLRVRTLQTPTESGGSETLRGTWFAPVLIPARFLETSTLGGGRPHHDAMSIVLDRPAAPSLRPVPEHASTASAVWFTFDVDAGMFRRNAPREMATKMGMSGLDVSWSDRRSGLFGITRRFTVRGERTLVAELIDAITGTLGWQPGAIALPNLRP
jgi:hypothetical protein